MLDWKNSLINLGSSFRSKEFSSKNTSLVVCLPRLDFAHSFISIGILGNIFKESNLNTDISNLLSKNVTFYDKNKKIIGKLEEIEEIEGVGRCAKIVHHRNTKGTSKSLDYIVPETNWASIALAKNQESYESKSNTFNPLKLTKKSSGIFHYEGLENKFGKGFCSWLMKQSDDFLHLLPESKKRLNVELSNENIMVENLGEINVGKILQNRVNILKYDEIIFSPSATKIIESCNMIYDFIENHKDEAKIILLGRNQPSYNEYAAFINSFFSTYRCLETSPIKDISSAIYFKAYAK